MIVFSVDDAAKRLSLTRRSLDRLFSIGEGPATVSLGKRRYGVTDVDLDAWLLKRRSPAPGENDPAVEAQEQTAEARRKAAVRACFRAKPTSSAG